MANELFNRYLVYAEKFGEEFAKKRNLEIEDVVQDARVYLLEYSENYKFEISDFGKHFRSALNAHIKSSTSKYMVCSYPAHMSRQIHKLMDAFDCEMPSTDNIQYVSDILRIPPEESRRVISCYAQVVNAEELISLDDVDENDFAINDNYFVGYDVIDVINIINRYCNCRERDIIIRVVGLIGSHERFDEINEEYGISKQRVGQIYKEGLDKMNNPEVYIELKQLLTRTR